MSETLTNAVVDAARPDALRGLLDASVLLLAATRTEEVLTGILDLSKRVIAADAYAVWRTYDSHKWRVVASSGLSDDYRTEVEANKSYRPELQAIPDVSAHPLVSEYRELYREHGVRSILVVPLTLQDSIPEGPNGGTITLYWRTQRDFSELDIAYASALANLSSAALNLATLNEQTRKEKARLAFLAEASAVLASSLDYETTLERVAQLAVPHVADWCVVHVVESGVPNRIVVAHADASLKALVEEFSQLYPEKITPERGLGYVLRTGKPECIFQVTDAMIGAAAVDARHLEMLRRLELRGSILVPLVQHGGASLGAIRLLAAGKRRFSQDDLRLAEDLARRAAAAIENARLHREVLDQENRLRLAHSAAHMGTWSWDLAKGELFWSDEWKRLHGLPLQTTPSQELGRELIHPDDREQVLSELGAALQSDRDTVVFEHRSILSDGRLIWLHHRSRIERDNHAQAVAILGISMDITERRQAEEALRRTEKLAAAGRLAATVAHEINNPLASIVNLVYLAKLSPGLSPDTKDLLDSAEGELNRTAQIVRQTLGFYRESVHPQESDISRIVSEILELYRSRIQARALICEVSIQPGLMASVIPGELKQVVANLISNSIDATASGGRIRVSVWATEADIRIAVSDTGTGIPDSNLPRLFEPFFTTKEDVGTGLGLWVSKGIVDKHRGTITVTTSVDDQDHGSTFTVTIPITARQASREI